MGNEGNRRPRVVVVGGGFAELSAVRELGGADVEVLLLDGRTGRGSSTRSPPPPAGRTWRSRGPSRAARQQPAVRW